MSAAGYLTTYNRSGPSSIGTVTNLTFDDSGDGLAWIFQPTTADPITHIGFRYGSRTGTPPAYIASLQAPTSGGGVPDTTVLGGGSPASIAFTPPANATWDGTWQWVQLANAYTPGRGDYLAACIEYSSGTVDGSNNSSFSRGLAGMKQQAGYPYACVKAGGTWSRQNSAIVAFGYRTASGRYGFVTSGSASPTVSTSGHRSVMHFTLSAGFGDTFKLAGASLVWDPPSAGGAPIFGIWNAAGTLLASKTLDTDIMPSVTASAHEYLFADATLPALSFGTKYYIGFESTGASHGVFGSQLASADDRGAWPDGLNRGYSSWDGAVWTDDNTIMPLVELIFADITEPAGGGGLILPRSMNGGLV